jgi:tetratricopeptide (TPR) repeat protein
MTIALRNRGEPLSPLEAYEVLQEFGRQNGAARLMLLSHCAVPEQVRPDLVNLIKANFLPETGSDLSVDADVLFCPMFEPIGTDFYRMETEIRRQCLAFLDSVYRWDEERRTNQVARFVLRYLDELETKPDARADLVSSEFIDIQRWGAWAFLDPSRTAREMAQALATHMDSNKGTHFRLEGVTAAVSIPLAGHQELLAYARSLNAIQNGNARLARELIEALDEETVVENVELPSLRAVLGARGTVGASIREADDSQAHQVQTLRVWVTSPTDVAPEREALLETIEGINREVGYESLSCRRAENSPEPAAFQSQELVDVDLVVGILWSRIGIPLPADFERKPSGDRYQSSVAYELLRSIEASRRNGRPDVLLYFKSAPVTIAVDRSREAVEQFEALQRFRSELGSEASFQTFSTTDDFRDLLSSDLRTWLRYHGRLFSPVTEAEQSVASIDFVVICSASFATTADEVVIALREGGYSGEIAISTIDTQSTRRALRRARHAMVLLSSSFDTRIMRLPEASRFQPRNSGSVSDRLIVFRLEVCPIPREFEQAEIRALDRAKSSDDRRACVIAAAKGDPDPSRRFRHDFFVSRRGSVAAIAAEVAEVLTDRGYNFIVQDYDIPLGARFVEVMHDAVSSARDLIILFTHDYEQSPYTRKEFTSFEAERAQSLEERRIIVFRCEDVPLRGLLADNVYQDLVDVGDREERRRRIITAVEGPRGQVAPQIVFAGVPPRVAQFTGRTDELERLDAILSRDIPAAVTQAAGRAAVQGLGGVGKTSLAIEYVHRFRNLYAGVWWCPAETRSSLLSGLAGLAVAIGAAEADEPDVEKVARAGLIGLSKQRAPWLLVYDNVTAPEVITDLFPTGGARLLITSRFSDWGGWAEELALDVLPLDEAVAFLQGRAGRSNEAGARKLAQALGGLPLALDHAAAMCRRTQMRFSDYAEKVEKLIAAAPRGAGYPRSVAATFDLAIAQAVAQSAAAEGIMAFLAQCAPERIPMILVEGAIEGDLAEPERLNGLAALVELSLVKHDPFDDGAPAVTVSRLVQMVAQVRSESRGITRRVVERLIARLGVIYPTDALSNPQSWSLCAQLTPHLLAQRDLQAGRAASAEWADLLERAGLYFHGIAAYSAAEPLLRTAIATFDGTGAREQASMAQALSNLANLLQDQGNFLEARPLFEQALAICERTAGPEHPSTAQLLNDLGRLLQAQGDLAGALPLFKRALAISEKARGPDRPDTALRLNNLAALLQDQGNFSEAQPLYERALAIRERMFGPEHPDTATSLNDLARLLQAEGDLARARPLFERALAIQEKVLGAEHPSTAQALNNLASLLEAQGDFVSARPLLERALAICQKVLGLEHHLTAQVLNNLAILLQAQDEFASAQQLFERALSIRERALGAEHPLTAQVLSNLAHLHQVQGDLDAARSLYERALSIYEKILGPEHPSTRRLHSDLSSLA